MHRYYLKYNNIDNNDLGVWIDRRPSKPAPIMEYETVKVPGGKTLYREKGYNDIEITVDMNFLTRESYMWDRKWREIKSWLLSNVDNKLKFEDDLEGYYIVNKVEINTPERIVRRHGKFTVTFTCEPYFYYDTNEIEIIDNIQNDYLESRPIYRITGNGNLNFTINNKSITVNVGQELIIDTDKGLCYRQGVINNVALTGSYEDLYLKHGLNTFVWIDKTFKIYVDTKWRSV